MQYSHSREDTEKEQEAILADRKPNDHISSAHVQMKGGVGWREERKEGRRGEREEGRRERGIKTGSGARQ